jgi:hypothetical protein
VYKTHPKYKCIYLFIVYLTMLSVAQTFLASMIGLMNNELERMWKEMVMAQFTALSKHLPGGTRKTTKRPCSQDSQPLSQDLNQRPPEYEAGALTT